LTWKSAQYRRSNLHDVLANEWTVKLLRNILARQDKSFAGMLSALYVGDRLAAVHLGMRAGPVLHSWFPAYDLEFSKYSVGLILLLEMARAAETLGIHRIDLGKGPEQYKRDFMSAATLVAEGTVDRGPLTYALRHGWHRARDMVKSSPVGPSAQRVSRWLLPAREWLAFR
jgi:CelD/BcsL family acetyltransferase involved in cellulose biosynthesis